MTVAVVVVAAVVVPKSPTGSILSVDAFTNVITYTVNITDEDNAILTDTLCLRLENQIEVYDKQLSLGMNSGIYEGLNPNTEYTIKILANKGYGLEVLDRTTLKTAERTGGAITGFTLLSEEDAWSLDYSLNYFISDPFDEYKQISLRYGVIFAHSTETVSYLSLTLDELLTEILVQGIFNENVEISVILEATKQNDEVIELDNLTFHTPFRIYSSFGIEHVTNDSVSVYVWPESVEGIDIEYDIVLSRLGYVIDKQTVEPFSYEDEQQSQFESNEITFEGLIPEKEYTVSLIARYSDPYTMAEVEKVLGFEDFTTTPDFDYEIEVIDHDDHYAVTITVNPEDAIYDFAYFYTYVNVDGFYQYYEYSSYNFEIIDNHLEISFIIYKPENPNYRIIIAIGDQESYINYVVLNRIETTQEG